MGPSLSTSYAPVCLDLILTLRSFFIVRLFQLECWSCPLEIFFVFSLKTEWFLLQPLHVIIRHMQLGEPAWHFLSSAWRSPRPNPQDRQVLSCAFPSYCRRWSVRLSPRNSLGHPLAAPRSSFLPLLRSSRRPASLPPPPCPSQCHTFPCVVIGLSHVWVPVSNISYLLLYTKPPHHLGGFK